MMLTTVPRFTLVPAAGVGAMGLPVALPDRLPGVSPALGRVCTACAGVVVPTTFGITTRSWPFETTMVIVVPAWAVLPRGGRVPITTPLATVSLNSWTVTT